MRVPSSVIAVPWLLLLFADSMVSAFVVNSRSSVMLHPYSGASRKRIQVAFSDVDGKDAVKKFEDDNEIMSDDDDEEFDFDGADYDEVAAAAPAAALKQKNNRWNRLHPKLRAEISKAAQKRAIVNKKKREPSLEKKRRLLMWYKKSQRDKKRASRVKRPIPFDDRTPLSALTPGMELTGTVISLTKFGSYVDVGTECDGLLHISQMSRKFFVEHPRQIMSPGDEVTVRIKSFCPELKKLHLTMLTKEEDDDDQQDDDEEERILLQELNVEDELWGEIRRVTAYGAYVELGAEVDGFLHFMDHPQFTTNIGAPPSDYMTVGDRIRLWVSDVDMDKMRIKLTANRPSTLPGPRFEKN